MDYEAFLKRNNSNVMKEHTTKTLLHWFGNTEFFIRWHRPNLSISLLFWKRLRWRIYRAIRKKEER